MWFAVLKNDKHLGVYNLNGRTSLTWIWRANENTFSYQKKKLITHTFILLQLKFVFKIKVI